MAVGNKSDLVKKARVGLEPQTETIIGRGIMNAKDASSSMEVESEDVAKKPPPSAADDARLSSGDAPPTDKSEAVFNSKLAFPLSLTHMLESVESMGLSHIIHWAEHEKSFMICDIDGFVSEVLPKFFK